MRRLAEDLLVLSRAEGGRLSLAQDPLVLGHIIRRALKDESARWPSHRFESHVAPRLPMVLGEDLHVGQVLQNLLSNAAKYSPAGSLIEVTADDESDGATIRVLDEGSGLPPGDPTRLFDLFYRDPGAARQATGAGIGLFVCRQLVEDMGGRVWARPRKPRGAQFGFWLPALREEDID